MGNMLTKCKPAGIRYRPPIEVQDAVDVFEPDQIIEYFEARDCWDFMCNGCKLLKIKSKKKNRKKKRKGKKKYFVLDEDLMGFRYSPSHKPKGYKISLDVIKDILYGNQIREQDRIAKYHKDCQLIIVYERKKVLTQMHLVAFSLEAAKKWAFGLQAVLRRKGLLLSKPDPLRDEWLKSAFTKYDADGNGALSLSEVENLLISLNIYLDSKMLKMLFNEANIQGIQGHKDGTLTKEEFADFFKRISTREEIVSIILSFAENKTSMNVKEFKKFLSSEYNIENLTDEDCRKLIKEFEPVEELREADYLGMDGLTKYLLSSDGDIFDPKRQSVYHDMTQPLSHYFIASSHNTYLTDDQLRGPSSVDAYISALTSGCRCVEIDCWDGDDNEPVIYHGYTLTSKILFKDAVTAVKEYAFYSSPYPLILSLENHCSVEQQKIMAKHLVEILGDQLYVDDVDEELLSLPSPEFLKYKILIKGKKLTKDEENDDENPGNVSEDDEAAEFVVEGAIQDEVDFIGLRNRKEERNKEKSKIYKYSGASISSFSRSFSRGSKHNLKLAKELSRLVNYIRSVKFISFENSYKKYKPYEMSSFGESKFLSLGESDSKDFIRHNTKFLSRTYPAGRRVDSSNYNPQDAWNIGCQIVALNYQTDGQMMDIYRGKFRDNNNCGYLLKPWYMRDEHLPKDFVANAAADQSCTEIVTIEIISAQQLPKDRKSGVVDPYVQVEIYGLQCDANEKAYCTKTIHNNGFNPVWKETFTLQIHFPEMALIRFAVYDSDYGSDDFLAQCTIPFNCIRQGYRHMQLLSKQGNILSNSTLFLRIKIKEA